MRWILLPLMLLTVTACTTTPPEEYSFRLGGFAGRSDLKDRDSDVDGSSAGATIEVAHRLDDYYIPNTEVGLRLGGRAAGLRGRQGPASADVDAFDGSMTAVFRSYLPLIRGGLEEVDPLRAYGEVFGGVSFGKGQTKIDSPAFSAKAKDNYIGPMIGAGVGLEYELQPGLSLFGGAQIARRTAEINGATARGMDFSGVVGLSVR